MMYGFVDEPHQKAIVLEYAKYGALGSFLRDLPEHPPLSITVRMVQQLTKAMAFLHHELNPFMLHRDLKADNILVDTEFNAKLTDFGLSEFRAVVKCRTSKLTLDDARVHEGTISHVPPEKFKCPTSEPSKTYDIYSYAITLWEILSRQDVWIHHAKLGDFKVEIIDGYRPPDASLRRDCPEELKALMKRCWDAEMIKRPYFEDIRPLLEEMTSQLEINVSQNNLKILQKMADLKDCCHQNVIAVQVCAEDMPENQVNHGLEKERTEPKQLLQKKDKEDAMQKGCITLKSSHVIDAIPRVIFHDVAVVSAGAVFVATSQGLREYDSRGQEVSRPLTEGYVLSVDVFGDGRVAAGLSDNSVAVLSRDEAQSSRKWRVTATFQSKVTPRCLAVAQDDSCLSVADGRWGGGRVLYVYLCRGQLLLEKDLGYLIQSLASSTAAVVVSSCDKREPPLEGYTVEAYSYSGQMLWQRTSSDRACDQQGCPDPGSMHVYMTVADMSGVRVLRGEGQQGTVVEIVSGSEALQQPLRMSMDRQATCLAVISGWPHTVTVFTVAGL